MIGCHCNLQLSRSEEKGWEGSSLLGKDPAWFLSLKAPLVDLKTGCQISFWFCFDQCTKLFTAWQVAFLSMASSLQLWLISFVWSSISLHERSLIFWYWRIPLPTLIPFFRFLNDIIPGEILRYKRAAVTISLKSISRSWMYWTFFLMKEYSQINSRWAF